MDVAACAATAAKRPPKRTLTPARLPACHRLSMAIRLITSKPAPVPSRTC